MVKRKKVFMNIKDKTIISKINCCPPHYLPHRFPIGEKVTDEHCHFHKARWRMKHHLFFCKILKCPHFENMKKSYEDWLAKNIKK